MRDRAVAYHPAVTPRAPFAVVGLARSFVVVLAAILCIAGTQARPTEDAWAIPISDTQESEQLTPPAKSSEILVLYSYSARRGYTLAQQGGIIRGLGGRFARNLTIYEEYLHAEAPTDESVEEALVSLLKQRYGPRHLRLVIAADTPATNFVAKHWHTVFEGVPVVFSAATRIPPEVERESLPFTGVLESLSVTETLDLIRTLFPQTRRVLVATTHRESARLANDLVAAAFAIQTTLEPVWVDGPTFDEQVAALATAKETDVILHIDTAPDGKTLVPISSPFPLGERSPRPIFALYSAPINQLNTYALGGVVASGESFGLQAAAIARRILMGEDPASIPIVRGANVPMFDERLLARWRIPHWALPAGSIITNRSDSFWTRNAEWLAAGALFIVLQSAIIAALVIARRRASATALRALEGEERYRALADNVPGVAYTSLYSPTGERVLEFASPALERLLGQRVAAQARKDMGAYFALISPADQQRIQAAADAALAGAGTMECDYILSPPGRDPIWVRMIARGTVLKDRMQRWHGLILDITDQKRTALARNAVEERLRLASLAGDDVIWDWDLVTGRVLWNDAVTNLLGYPADLRDTDLAWWLALVHPDDRKRADESLHRAFKDPSMSTWSEEYRFARADGSYIDVIDRCCMVRDEGGQVVRAVGVMFDITLRKNAERELRESEQRYRGLVSMAGAVLWRAGLSDFMFTFVSKEAERLLGYPVEKWLEPGFWVKHVHSDDLEWATSYCLAQTEAGIDHVFEYRMIAADGRVVWLRDDVRLTKSSDGRTVEISGVMFDITLRKNAEQALRESESRMRAIADHIPGVVFRSLQHPDGTLERIFTSAGYQELFGSAPGHDRRSMHADDPRFEPDDARRYLDAMLAAAVSGGPVDLVLRVVRADGERRWVNLRARPTRGPGASVTWDGVLLDITDLKRVESERDQLIDIAPDMISISSFEGSFLVINSAWERTLGWTLEEMTTTPWIEFVHPDDHPATMNAFRELLSGARLSSFRNRYRCRDGSYKTLSWNAIPQLDRGLIFGSARDVTDSERQTRLVEQTNHAARIGGWEFDVQAGRLYWSEEVFRIHDLKPDESEPSLERAIGFYAPESIQIIRDAVQAAIDFGQDYSLELPLVTANGRPIWVHAIGFAERIAGKTIRVWGSFQDITQRKNAESDLRERQAFLDRVALAAPIILYVYDLELKKNLYVNGHIFSMLGYTPEDVREMGADLLQKLMHPDDFASYPAHYARLLTAGDGEVVLHEYRMRDTAGEYHWLSGRETVLARRPDGTAKQIVGTSLDITELRRSADALALSETRYRLASRATNDVIWDWDIVTNSLSRSDSAAATALTAAAGAPLGEHPWWRDNLHPDDAERVLAGLKAALLGVATGWGDEYRLRKPDGRYADIADRGYIVRDASGRALRMIGAMSDVTRRKAVETRLRESEQRLRQITDNAREVFWVTNADGSELQYISPAFREVWGFDPNALLERSSAFRDTIHPEDLPAFIKANEHAVRRGFDVQYRIVRPDGGVRWIRDRAYPVRDHRGVVYRVAGIAEDVTESRRSQDEISRTNEVLQLLLGELDHRVKNALSGLLTLIDQTALSTTAVEEFAESIRTRVSAMASVHALLSESKWKPLELRKLTSALYPPDAAGALSLEGPPTPVPARQATALAMVIQELMTNSVKHGAAGAPSGRVQVSWAVMPGDGQKRIEFHWREEGGPPPREHPEKRLGSRLIEGFTHFELAGEAKLGYSSRGADHRLIFRFDSTADDRGQSPASAKEAELPATTP